MVRTIVITGGTSNIGRALAEYYLDQGEEIIVVAPDPVKGQAFRDAAETLGAAERAHFIQADLSLVAENQRVVREIVTRFPVVDALVLCARYFRSHRAVTSEGLESNFALYYLSRYLLGHGLADQLAKADHPIIMNIAGPGMESVPIRWDDLGFEQNYDGWSAMFQGGPLNDLLGVSFAASARSARYVVLFPGGTRTGLSGEFDPGTVAQVERMKLTGKPVEMIIPAIIDIINAPPGEPLSAFVEGGTPLGLDRLTFDKVAAARLETITRQLLHERFGVS